MKSNNKSLVKNTLAMLGCFLILFSMSCKKLVEVPAPVTSISDADVYTNDGTAISVLTGIYIQMSQYNTFPGGGWTSPTSVLLGLSSDELSLYSASYNQGYTLLYTNSLFSASAYAPNYWGSIYSVVFICNAAITGLNNSNSLTPAVKQQLLGEAKFMRAFCYFYLVNLYDDVPLVTGTDYNVNRLLPRSPKAEVYQQIIADLHDAENLLSPNYLDATLLHISTDRVRPTKWAAAALLARADLYSGDWAGADSAATAVINNSSLYNLPALNSVFLKSSSAAIWQLQPVIQGLNTGDAMVFIIPSSGFNSLNSVYVSPQLLNSFEAGDQRRSNWVDSVTVSGTSYYYPYKYKVNTQNAPVTEYQMILRLAEQYLIRSEARTETGDILGAQADLNTIRGRSGLSNTTANDKSSLLTAILHERQVELFTEWGQRWFDLKRTNNVDSVMSEVCPQKGTTWSSYKQLFPIPLIDIQHDPNLTQNPGY